jgi:hypothetical protein
VAVVAVERCIPRRMTRAAAAKRMAERRARTLPITECGSTRRIELPRD